MQRAASAFEVGMVMLEHVHTATVANHFLLFNIRRAAKTKVSEISPATADRNWANYVTTQSRDP
jgi:hypothetical protein